VIWIFLFLTTTYLYRKGIFLNLKESLFSLFLLCAGSLFFFEEVSNLSEISLLLKVEQCELYEASKVIRAHEGLGFIQDFTNYKTNLILLSEYNVHLENYCKESNSAFMNQFAGEWGVSLLHKFRPDGVPAASIQLSILSLVFYSLLALFVLFAFCMTITINAINAFKKIMVFIYD
jgi:hypothetical protein